MKDCLKKIIEANKIDMGKENIYRFHKSDTELFSVLEKFKDEEVRKITALMLVGMEKTFNKRLNFDEMLSYCKDEPIVKDFKIDSNIDYIVSKRDRLNQYLEVALDNMEG